jgi:hypothetical protein
VFAYAIEFPLVACLQFVDLVTVTQVASPVVFQACIPAATRYPKVAFLHVAPAPFAVAAVHTAEALDAHPVFALANGIAN